MNALTDKQIAEIADAIACTEEPVPEFSDNLAIMLCSYFSDHLDRPDDDEENEDNHHWGAWVLEREKAMRRAIALTAIKAVTKALRDNKALAALTEDTP